MLKSLNRSLFITPILGLLILLMMGLFPANGDLAEAGNGRYERSSVDVNVPDVVLVDQNGEKVRFRKLLSADKPVLVDFIYCTCTTICPVLSSGYVNLQHKLGSNSAKVQLVSISIDPENDTPGAMKDYLRRFQAKPGWDFLTGTRRDIDRVMKAFNAYFPNKMSHKPLTFIRSPRDGKWVLLNGTVSAADLMSEANKAGL